MKLFQNFVLTFLLIAMAPSANAQTNEVKIETQGSYRIIIANGIPNHPTGKFPNSGNPNTIQVQNYKFRVPAKPKLASKDTALVMNLFGVAINGVPYDPGAAEWWNNDRQSGWRYEALSGKINLGIDFNNAHVQPNGAYHYHGLPIGLIATFGNAERMLLLGYAADGFPIYGPNGYNDPKNANSRIKKVSPSYRLKQGTRPSGPGGKYDGTYVEDYEYVKSLGDLDECNGRFGVTPEYADGIYHYYITSAYPFIPRCFRGTPDQSFKHKGPGPGHGHRPPPAQ